MTKAENISSAEADAERQDGHRLRRPALLVIALTSVLLALGVSMGAAIALFDGVVENPAAAWIVIAASLVIAGLAGWWLYRLRPLGAPDEPVSAKTRNARKAIAISMFLGALIAAVMAVVGDPTLLFSNDPVPPVLAVVVIALWLVGVPLLSWRWWKNIDEHEAQAYRSGALAASNVYVVLVPCWWLAWRGGFLPEPREIVIFPVFLFVFSVVWLVRRYR